MKRMNIFLEIQSKDEGLVSEIMEAPKKLDIKADLPGNAVIMKVEPSIEGKAMFLLSFGAKVAPELLASWLYEKLNDRATKLIMDRTEVQINKSEIERVISEIIAAK
jgi:hypothetical protein